jgi:hypothetical protein
MESKLFILAIIFALLAGFSILLTGAVLVTGKIGPKRSAIFFGMAALGWTMAALTTLNVI